MGEYFAPLEREPVSVHAPFTCYPAGAYRYEGAEERRAALVEALHGVELGAYDRRIVEWLIDWEVSTVAVVVSLLWRVRAAAAHQGCRCGGES
jgi:hypothetical protein